MTDDRVDVTPTRCPACGVVLDAATSPQDRQLRPRPGDYSVCMYCATPLVFTEDGDLRRMTAEEFGVAVRHSEYLNVVLAALISIELEKVDRPLPLIHDNDL
jgi:hypothetical protein